VTRIIAIANQKGGVGKTTTGINLASGLAGMKCRVLLIDIDPQGNATVGLGVDAYHGGPTTCEVLLGEVGADDAIQRLDDSGLDLMPANPDLTAAEVELTRQQGGEKRLNEALCELPARYHYVLIDCPPALNLLTLNALVAAHGVLIPMQCEYYAMEGLTALINTIKQVQSNVNPRLEIEGLVRTMYDVRNNLSGEVSRQLLEYFGDKVYRTVIPRNVRVAEAPSFGQPVLDYDRGSRGSLAYLGLAGEFLRRNSATPAAMQEAG